MVLSGSCNTNHPPFKMKCKEQIDCEMKFHNFWSKQPPRPTLPSSNTKSGKRKAESGSFFRERVGPHTSILGCSATEMRTCTCNCKIRKKTNSIHIILGWISLKRHIRKSLLRLVQSIKVHEYRSFWKLEARARIWRPLALAFIRKPHFFKIKNLVSVIRTNTNTFQMVFVSCSCQLVKMVFVRAFL